MREILFRGKHAWNKSKGWIYGSLIHIEDYCCILDQDDVDDMNFPYLDADLGTIDGQATPVIPKTVGQFTSLHDKNGVRIFEGDIVRFASGITRSVVFNERLAEFEFNKYDPVENPDGWCLCCDHDYCEVIGNIHDNPELLGAVG